VVGLDQGLALSKLNLQVGTGAALALSALGVPAAWPFVPPLYVHQYDPQLFWDAGMAWFRVVDQVSETRKYVQQLVEGAPEGGWQSEDGRAFGQRMDRFIADLISIELRATAVGVTMLIAALALMAMIVFLSLVTAFLVLMAAWVLIATITPVSAAVAGLQAIGALTSVNGAVRTAEGLLNVVLHSCAGTLGLAIAGDLAFETVQGDFSGVQDFITATVAQGPMLIWGTANRLERDATAYGLGGKLPADGLYGKLLGGQAGKDFPAGWQQAIGAKAFWETQYGGGSQAITGRFTPEQNPDGSYPYPWE
jgi:hypothetical protein